jgi:hypothetical protein
MRTLVMVALAATLVGCSYSCPVRPQANAETCLDGTLACFDWTADSEQIELKPVSLRANSAATRRKSTIADTEEPVSARARDRADLDKKNTKLTMAAAKVELPASGQPAATSDPIMVKAKATIAAKLEDPASAEFVDMKRAIRKNSRGESVDTICGHVKGKKATGEDTGDSPFLYLVKDDDAYIVTGRTADLKAMTAYRSICN